MVFQEKRIYSWNGPQRKVSAQKVGEHLEEIEQRDGTVTKEAFLESARPSDSPMHPLFEWNDKKAAEKWRLQQSNQIINCLLVEVVDESGDEPEVRTLNAYVNIEKRGNGKASFINIRSAASNAETRDHVIDNALRDLRWIQRKYDDFLWFSSISASIDDFIAEQDGGSNGE